MYSPVACPPNHHQTTRAKPTPIEIHAADSIAASFVLMAWASRWMTRRSIEQEGDDDAEQHQPLPRIDVKVDEAAARFGGEQ